MSIILLLRPNKGTNLIINSSRHCIRRMRCIRRLLNTPEHRIAGERQKTEEVSRRTLRLSGMPRKLQQCLVLDQFKLPLRPLRLQYRLLVRHQMRSSFAQRSRFQKPLHMSTSPVLWIIPRFNKRSDTVADHNEWWICIHVRPGVASTLHEPFWFAMHETMLLHLIYWLTWLPWLLVQRESPNPVCEAVRLPWRRSGTDAGSTSNSPTFKLFADNFTALNITFKVNKDLYFRDPREITHKFLPGNSRARVTKLDTHLLL